MDRFDSIYQQWSDSAENAYDTLPANPNLTPSQIDLLLVYAEGVGAHGKNIKEEIARHSALTPAQFQKLFTEYGFKDELTQNPHLTTDQIDLLYSTNSGDTRLLGAYSKLTEAQFNRFVNDDQMIREGGIKLSYPKSTFNSQANRLSLQHLSSFCKRLGLLLKINRQTV